MEEVLTDADSPEQAQQDRDVEGRDDTENVTQPKAEEEVHSIQWSEGRKVRRFEKNRALGWGCIFKETSPHLCFSALLSLLLPLNLAECIKWTVIQNKWTLCEG